MRQTSTGTMLAVIGLVAALTTTAHAAFPCLGTYRVTGSALGAATAPERLTIADGTMALDGCGIATARGPRARVKAVFRDCTRIAGRVRVVVTADPSDCATIDGVLRARRARLRTAFVATATGSLAGRVRFPAAADDAGADPLTGEMIVRLRDGAPPADDLAATKLWGDPHDRGGALYAVAPGVSVLDTVRSMRERPDVLWVQPNYRRHALRIPNDPFLPLQWHYPMISLPAAWDVTIGSPDVVVAVIDTGLLTTHPDIAPARLVPGFDFITDPAIAGDGDGIDADPFDVGDGGPGAPSSFHGTHVTGTIGAATDNGTGVAGIDWNARIMPLRVLGRGGGTDFDIAQAIRFAAGLANVSGRLPAQRADVVNMSLGGPGQSPAMHEAIQDARAAETIVVVAAGNDAVDAAGFTPAAFPEVVCVSAVDARGARAVYSNFGAVVDVAAPGGDTRADTDRDGFADGVLSTLGDDTGNAVAFVFGFLQGTSMAAPHVTGVVALMQAAFMEAHAGARLTPDALDAMLRAGALTGAGGLIDAHKAVLAAAALDPGDPPAPTTPTAPARITVQLLDPSSEALVASVDADVNGRFDFGEIPAGDYTLRAESGTGDLAASRAVTVRAGELAEVDLVLDRTESN